MTTITYKGLLLEVDFQPGDPGRCYGPPENCYPPEPDEIFIEEISIEDRDEYEEHFGPVVNEDEDFLKDLLDDDHDDLIELAREAYEGDRDSFYAGDYD